MSTTRRSYGSGGLSQRSDGLWVARVYAGWTPQGTRRRITVSSRSKAEATRKLRDLQRRLNAGEVVQAGGARVTVKQWSETWLPIHATRVRPTTAVTDAGATRKWIIPTIGHRRLTDLTPADLRALRTAITDAGRSTTTARHAHKILIKMLRDAVVEGHSVPPRIFEAPKPTKARSDRDAIPVEHLVRILAVIADRADAGRWLLAIFGGVRQGEALGLLRDRVDLAAGTVAIEWQLQRRSAAATPDGWEEKPCGWGRLTRPKTGAGRRVVPLVDIVSVALERTIATTDPGPWGLVWSDHHGQPIRPEADRATWHVIQGEATERGATEDPVAHPSGRPWHVHECRHAAATLLVMAGVDRTIVQSILGQSALVETYVHVEMAAARAALDRVVERVTRAQAPQITAPTPRSLEP